MVGTLMEISFWTFLMILETQLILSSFEISKKNTFTISKFWCLEWRLQLNAINTLSQLPEVLRKHCARVNATFSYRFRAYILIWNMCNVHISMHCRIGAIQIMFFSLSKINYRRNIFVIHKHYVKRSMWIWNCTCYFINNCLKWAFSLTDAMFWHNTWYNSNSMLCMNELARREREKEKERKKEWGM